ncbi:SCO2522 family protein [Yinghuangia sp. YIM S09857]|uniref:SCO2522 family protein n=1 Tax=Yinghuangia sp. YIM S09857 TaxID=3436929 RepID=UPI003F52EC19
MSGTRRGGVRGAELPDKAPEETVFREWSAEAPTESIPYAHLSIELGHLYMEDFARGAERLRAHFAAVAPWVAAARATAAPPGTRPRVSTCFLIDDYFTRFSTPAEVIPELLRAAEESGLRIDYLARESGCADSGSDPGPASLLEARLVPAPLEGTNGRRPPAHETGWLCNGLRTPSGSDTEAMAPREGWRPPREIGARNHSVFLDVELWGGKKPGPGGDGELRLWSCPFLAAVWQLLRLGLLRDRGAPVLPPVPWTAPEFPRDWDDLPAVVRLDPAAAPFAAYRTFSVLGTRFLPIEHAVRLILGHTAVDPVVGDQAVGRAAAEGVFLPRDPTGRIAYTFVGGDPADGDSAFRGGRT